MVLAIPNKRYGVRCVDRKAVNVHVGVLWFLFFFFQAEDGIRDYKVTGVQTCALPIYSSETNARLVAAAPVRPIAAPSAVSAVPRPITRARMSAREAPNAARTPISRTDRKSVV